MTSSQFRWTGRTQTVSFLLHGLECSSDRCARMELLAVLANREDQPAIEAATCSLSGWGRRLGIRWLIEQGPVGPSTYSILWNGASDVWEQVEILGLAKTPPQVEVATSLLSELAVADRCALLEHADLRYRYRVPSAFVQVLFQGIPLDASVAWATWAEVHSRAWLFDAGPLDLRQLGAWCRGRDASTVAVWFRDQSEALDRAVEALVLPTEVLKTQRSDAQLLVLALALLRSDRPVRERFPAAAVLSCLPASIALPAIDRAVEAGVESFLLAGARQTLEPSTFSEWAHPRIAADLYRRLLLKADPLTWPIEDMLASVDGALRAAALERCPSLSQRFRQDPDPRVYLLADRLCGEVVRLREVAVLGSVGERATAVRYLGEIDGSAHRDRLQRGLGDREAFDGYLPVAEEAALALAQIGDDDAHTDLIRAALTVDHDELSLVLLGCVRLALQGASAFRTVWRSQWNPATP